MRGHRRERRRRADDQVRRPRERRSRRRGHRAEHGVARRARPVAARDSTIRCCSRPASCSTSTSRRSTTRAFGARSRCRSIASASCSAALAGFANAGGRSGAAGEPARARRQRRCATRRSPTRCSTPPDGRARPDGARARDGKPFAFDLLTVGSGDNALEQLVQADLGARGVQRQHPAGGARDVPHRRRARRTKKFDVLVAGIPGDVALAFLGVDVRVAAGRAARSTTPAFTRRRSTPHSRAARAARTDAERVAAWRRVQRSSPTQCRSRGSITRAACRASPRDLRNVVMDLRGELPTIARWETRRRDEPPALRRGARRAARRRRAGPLAPLARSLAGDLEPLLARELYFPASKALLSREGGRCPRDGALLEFDPFSPHEHRCPACGEVYRGELHDRFWIYWYQLWLAERAVHAAALFRARRATRDSATSRARFSTATPSATRRIRTSTTCSGRRACSSARTSSRSGCCRSASRPICSTTTTPALADRVRDRIIEPSRAIIAEYDEGGSNRQVWNDAALLAAARLLGDDARGRAGGARPVGRRVRNSQSGLLADGTWYEGENYHLFAHRGLWYGVTMAEQAGIELPRAARRAFRARVLDAVSSPRFPISRCRRAATRSTRSRCVSGASRSTASSDSRAAPIRRSSARSAACTTTTFRAATPAGAPRRPTSSATRRRRRSRAPT